MNDLIIYTQLYHSKVWGQYVFYLILLFSKDALKLIKSEIKDLTIVIFLKNKCCSFQSFIYQRKKLSYIIVSLFPQKNKIKN